MSVSTANVCPAILTSLAINEIFNPSNAAQYNGTLGALHHPENLARGQVIRGANNDGTGHKKSVRVVYKRRQVADDAVSTKNCDLGPELPYIEEEVSINNYKGISYLVTEEKLRTFCEAYSSLQQITGASTPGQIAGRAVQIGAAQGAVSVALEIFNDMQLSIYGLKQAINQDLLGTLASGAGTWVGGNATNAYQVQGADGGPYLDGLWDMKQDYTIAGQTSAPIIITGANALHRIWMNDSRFFGQAANGINFAEVRARTGIADLYYDENVAAELGNQTKAIIFAPGSALFLPFPQYVGNFGQIGTMTRFTMPMPGIDGMTMDVRILPNECDENYAIWMEAFYELYVPPTDMFTTGDNLDGVNGVFQATFTQA